jgi:hypothetical protein
MRPRPLALLAAGLLGNCGEAPAPTFGPEEQRREARTATEHLSAALRTGSVVPACGGLLPAKAPRLALLVNARQALSCRDLGYLLRRVPRSLEGSGAGAWVMIPAADTASVCPFLKQEKARLTVAAITQNGDSLRELRTVVMTRFRAAHPDTSYYAPTGRAVLLKYQQDPTNAVAVASPILTPSGAH